MKADWLIFFFEINFAFPCFRVRYEGKHIPLEIIILNCTQNVNCAFGYLIVHSGDQKCRIWKPGATPTWEPFCQMPTPCQQREGSSELRSLAKITDFITERGQREGRLCSVPEPAHLSSLQPSLPSLLAALCMQACCLQRHPMLAWVSINQILLNGAPIRQLFQTALRKCGWETFKHFCVCVGHDTCYKCPRL